jgi:AraC-like DNA-binding protein
MNEFAINPYLRVAMRSRIRAGHVIPRRVIYDYELIYVESGSITLTYGDVPFECPTGSFLLLCPGVPHSFLFGDSEVSQPHIHFDLCYRPESPRIPVSFQDIDSMTQEERSWIHVNHLTPDPSHPFLQIQDTATFLTTFYSILDGFHTLSSLQIKGMFLQLLSVLIHDNFPLLFEARKGYEITDQIKDCIDAGNAYGMDLEDFSKRFSYSKFHLDKKFKSRFGMGVIEYRNSVRMQHAKRMLDTETVTCVAERLGYSSIYAFSRAYKNYYGVSPTKNKSK